MSSDREPIKVVRTIGAAANTGGVEFPLLAAGSNHIRICGLEMLDSAGLSGATGSAYAEFTAYNKGLAGTSSVTVATRKNNAAADYVGAFTPWAITLSTTKANLQLQPGEALTLKVGGSGANGTLSAQSVCVIEYAIGDGGGQ